MVVREFVRSDYDRVRQIYQQGIDSNLCTFETINPSFEKWDHAHLEKGRLVVVDENKVVGYCCLQPTSQRKCYQGVVELSIYVDQKCASKGIGTMLFLELKKKMNSELWLIRSCIMADNLPSIRFHKKNGFYIVGRSLRAAKDCRGNWRDILWMEYRNSQSEVD